MLAKIRLAVLGLALSFATVVNLFLAPQIYEPRPPAFNGPDLAETPSWEGMAREMHAWWLADKFPGATIIHVGQLAPPGDVRAVPAGIGIADWSVSYLPLTVDTSRSAVDVSHLGIRSSLSVFIQFEGRIPCQADAYDPDSGGLMCEYVVAWNPDALTESPPVFVGARTIAGNGAYEVALIEQGLLESLTDTQTSRLPTLADPS